MIRALAALLLVGTAWAGCTDQVGERATAPREPDGGAALEAGAPAAEAGATPEAGRDRIVRVATYNVHLFFDPTCDSGSCDGSSFESTPSQAEFEQRAARLASTLERLDADVVALQEIENQTCFDAIVAALEARGLHYPVAVFGETGAPASVDVAILARGELLSVQGHRATPLPLPSGETTTFARELLEVRLAYGGLTLDVFAAHFRSKNNDDPARRLAEANAAGQILDAAAKARPTELVILGGDLNDVPGSEALVALEQPGTLVRLAADRPPLEQATYFYQGVRQAIDHLYGAAATPAAYVAKSAVALHDAGGGFGESDHGALRVDLARP